MKIGPDSQRTGRPAGGRRAEELANDTDLRVRRPPDRPVLPRAPTHTVRVAFQGSHRFQWRYFASTPVYRTDWPSTEIESRPVAV
ncbi:MAG TPA: hypothetical protein VNA25_01225, partial [Phycisphaerae bacterium]|nr:hypothetical protein [Phycisphaerae bacterium]